MNWEKICKSCLDQYSIIPVFIFQNWEKLGETTIQKIKVMN